MSIVLSVCFTSGCGNAGSSWVGWFGNSGNDGGTANSSGFVRVEPAVRQEQPAGSGQQQHNPLIRVEPQSGGFYVADVFNDEQRLAAAVALAEATAQITDEASLQLQLSAAPSSTALPPTSGMATSVPASPTPTFTATPSATFTPAATFAPTATPVPTATATPTVVRKHRLASTTNILVLGSDRRQDTFDWRTDVIMLIALDAAQGVAGVISFPRDIYIDDIPGSAPSKINVVDFIGTRTTASDGPNLLATILSRKLGIPIDHYVRFEFESFKDVVDALGGLRITVDCGIFDEIEEEDLYINLEPGTHVLDGKEALSYVRTRRAGGDLERVRRQQRVIWALRQQFLDQNWLPQIPALYTSLSDAIETDLGVLDIAQLARFGLNVSEDNVHGLVIGPPDMIVQNFRSGLFVFDADWPLISRTIETVFERPPFVDTNTVGPTGDQPYCP